MDDDAPRIAGRAAVTFGQALIRANDRIAELEAENARLRADAERLDWLSRGCMLTYAFPRGKRWWQVIGHDGGTGESGSPRKEGDLRTAIDRAMNSGEGQR